MKHLIKSFIPPIALQVANKITGRNIQWIGKYTSWDEANSNIKGKGYDPYTYLDKLINVMKVVRDDESKYERDSILFDKMTHPYPLLSSLFALTSLLQAKSLYVLDFGGSLGSLYFQNRKFLRSLPKLSWNILEQEPIIKAGKKHFQTQELLFHSSFEEAESRLKPQDTKILILSSVLQYLKNPYEVLDSLIERFNFDAIILDRTPCNKDEGHRIAIQKVPQKIYQAQYPCHLFQEYELLEQIRGGGYIMLDRFSSYCDNSNKEIDFLGFSFYKER